MTPKPPVGLKQRGAVFWKKVVALCDTGAAETELLLEACRTLDSVEDLQSRIDQPGTLREIRQQRLVLARLLAQLQIPNDLESSTTARSRRAAETRWAAS